MKSLLILFLFVLSNPVISQHNHSEHSHDDEPSNLILHPPHKGVVKQVGKYYIEVVSNWFFSKNNTVIYLLKRNGQPIENMNLICEVTTALGLNTKDINVIKYREDAFTTHLDPIESYEVEITFFIKKKEYKSNFKTKGNTSRTEESNSKEEHHH